MLFDTHVHYNLPPFYEDWQSYWVKAQEFGVNKSVVVGAGLNSSKKAVEVASKAVGLYAAVGKHPDVYRQAIKHKLQNREDWQSVFVDIDVDVKVLKDLIISSRETIKAIGEIGLDYYRLPEKGDKRSWVIEVQKKAFTAQIGLALEFNLPVIVHVRDKKDQDLAAWDAIKILKEYSAKDNNFNFVLHCFAGSKEYLQTALNLGGFIGVGGNITYADNDLLNLIKLVPRDNLLLETDAPYLAPKPHKAEVCEPWMVSVTAKFLEEKLGIKGQQLYDNACRFFEV